jgi:hypothetical protein
MYLNDPLSRLSNEQLESALDDALSRNDNPFVWQIVDEIERRGQLLEV